jgi:hypothetical protein
MELTYCACQRHGEAEELSDLHRLADEVIERLTTRVINHEHSLSALAYQFQRPQCPSAVQVTLKIVFVGETINAVQSRMLNAGRVGNERVLFALGVIPPQFAEGTSGISPQDLYGIVLPPRPEQDGRLHLFGLLLPTGSNRSSGSR